MRDVLSTPGRPLEPATRAYFEPRFARDFTDVRIHTGADASAATHAIDAAAYTVGKRIVVGDEAGRQGEHAYRRVIAHELAHVEQQRGATAPRTLSLARGETTAESEAETAASAMGGTSFSRRPMEVARQPRTVNGLPLAEWPVPTEAQIAAARRELVRRLTSSDSSGLLHAIDAMDPDVRVELIGDPELETFLLARLSGLARWSVRLALHFGARLPIPVRELMVAVHSHDTQRVAGLLRAFEDLTDGLSVPGVAELLRAEFRGRNQQQLLALAAEREVARRHGPSDHYREVHYETDDSGEYHLREFRGFTNYSVTRTASELRFIVRIRFVQDFATDASFYVPDARQQEWRQGIETMWNDRFVVSNGTARLAVVFVPVFTQENPHHRVRVQHTERENEHSWDPESSGSTVGHEFGPMIGNPDEYRLPGQIAEIPHKFRLTAQEELRSSHEGAVGLERPRRSRGYTLPGAMGTNTEALPRHVWPLLDWYNRNMKPPTEPRFQLESVR